MSRSLLFTVLAAFALSPLMAQDEPNPKTLIPQRTLEVIADEVSGTLTCQHILELAGYEHDRLADEYQSTYREAAYIEKMANSTAWKMFTLNGSSYPQRRGMESAGNSGF